MFIKLENNRIDLAADNLHEGREIIAELGKEDKFVILKPYFDTLFSYVIFSKKNNLEQLRNDYDATLIKTH